MVRIKTEKIIASNSKKENFYVFITILSIIFFATFLLSLNNSKSYTKVLEKNQISSLNLNNVEVSIFSQLGLFLNDYPYLKKEYKEVNLDLIANELYYSPFTKDAFWENSGKHEWSYIEYNNHSFFIGISSNKTIAGDFVAIINNKTNEQSIRYSKNFNFDKNENIRKTIDGISELKEINAFTGSDFIKEMKGTEK